MKRIELLDYARLLAALSVVGFHYFFNGIYTGKVTTLTYGPLAPLAKYGYLGVEFFFLISGYVIFQTARGKTPGEFAVSRAVRLFPAFWVAVLFTATAAAFWGGPGMDVTLAQVAANMTMVPSLLHVRPVDGVYWTLQTELTFYAAVLLLLVARQGRRLEVYFLCWPALMLAAAVLGIERHPFLGGYYPLFAAGAIFGMLAQRTLSRPNTLWACCALAICFVLVANAEVQNAMAVDRVKGVGYSGAVVIGIMALQFLFFVVLHNPRARTLRLPGARLAGGLTYPLYLVHAYVGYMLLAHFATEANKLVVYPAVLLVVLGVAYGIHELVERRLAGFWRAAFTRSVGVTVDGLARR